MANHSDKCLDVANASGDDGANLQQYDCVSGSEHQMFRFEEVSGSRQLQSDEVLSSEDELDKGGYSVYPNPASDVLNVELPAGADGTVKLISTTGGVVYSSEVTSSDQSINVNQLNSGVYILQVEKDGKNFRTKVTIK